MCYIIQDAAHKSRIRTFPASAAQNTIHMPGGKRRYMSKGKVEWFDARKGHGFIKGEDGVDAFVHYSDIQMEGFKKLSAGQDVTYELTEGKKGPRAFNVIPA